jgi:hypothetical protein
MAKNKESFILYSNIIHTISKLSDEQSGKLFKIILEYVNDKDPVVDDLLLQIAFEPIKQKLKEDLKKWEAICKRNSDNGLKGGRPKKPKKPTGLIGNPKKPKKADSECDSEYDNEYDNETNKKFIFLNALINLGVEKQIAKEWMAVRKTKKATNTETAFNKIKNQIDLSGLSANECIKIAVENSWAGFNAEWDGVKKSQSQSHTQQLYRYYVNDDNIPERMRRSNPEGVTLKALELAKQQYGDKVINIEKV